MSVPLLASGAAARGLRAAVAAIGVATLASGALQLASPGFVLAIVAGQSDAMSRHFFAIVGMFMALFGGLLLQVLASENSGHSSPVALLWCTLQKLGASLAVLVGVFNGVFSRIALLVAGFDFVSAIVFALYWRLRKASE